jgi:hypothetical protein
MYVTRKQRDFLCLTQGGEKMKENHIKTDIFLMKKRNLKIYRIVERGSANLLYTSEQQAARYVQRLHMNKLMIARKYR